MINTSNTESKWSQIEKRLNLQNIGKFIKHGSGDIAEIDKRSFIEREETAYQNLEEYLTAAFGKENAENIFENIAAYTGAREDIYFALGMKAGAQIIIQLTNNFEADF